jgi:hypothetical protein
MQWRQTRIARATNEKEVDSALESAEKVIVEGDDHLLSYAVAKASRDPEKDIEIQTEKEIEGKVIPDPPLLPPNRSTPEPFTKSIVVLIVLLFIMSLIAVFNTLLSDRDAPTLVRILIWPTVIVTATAALFLIAWRAIGAGRNVAASWKVTENVTGRVVISKVRTRAAKRGAV